MLDSCEAERSPGASKRAQTGRPPVTNFAGGRAAMGNDSLLLFGSRRKCIGEVSPNLI